MKQHTSQPDKVFSPGLNWGFLWCSHRAGNQQRQVNMEKVKITFFVIYIHSPICETVTMGCTSLLSSAVFGIQTITVLVTSMII